jgi:hypothetical protein
MKLKENSRLIDDIADCLLEDHIEVMNENATLRSQIEALKASLLELLDEYHPRESWSDETIEYEIQEGNMGARMVKRAYAALAQQAEPVVIPGAVPMSEIAARSRAMPERADALERARERLKQAEPVQALLRDALGMIRSSPWEIETSTQKRGETLEGHRDRMSGVMERNEMRRHLISAIEATLAQQAEPVVEPVFEPVFEIGFGWLVAGDKYPRGTKLYAALVAAAEREACANEIRGYFAAAAFDSRSLGLDVVRVTVKDVDDLARSICKKPLQVRTVKEFLTVEIAGQAEPVAVQAEPVVDDCTPNHLCDGRWVHKPADEICNRCGHE